VLVYLPLAVVACIVLARFWWNLPPGLRWPFACAAILFGGGSGGVEPVKASIASDEGVLSLRFYLAAAVSDSLEMIGLAVLLLTVLGELARRVGEVTVAFRRAPV
jgi:hypothetical protein